MRKAGLTPGCELIYGVKKTGFWLLGKGRKICGLIWGYQRVTLWWLFILGICLSLLPAIAQESPGNLIQQGRELYELQRFREAATVLESAAAEFDDRHDQVNRAIALSNLALVYQELGQLPEAELVISQAIAKLESQNPPPKSILADTLNIAGQIQLAQGQPQAAFDTWKRTETIYQQLGNIPGEYRSLINQSQALQALGLYRQALNTLEKLADRLGEATDSPLKVASLHSLGNTLRMLGDLDRSRQVLTTALNLAQELNLSATEAGIWLNLGNTARSQGGFDDALVAYQNAASLTANSTTKLQAELNHLRLLIDYQQWGEAVELWQKFRGPQSWLNETSLPPRVGIEARINLAESLIRLQNAPIINQELSRKEAIALLEEAIEAAIALEDLRSQAYALGLLGGIYEQTQQWSQAQTLTQRALFIAQSINAPDIGYRWQWQLGRLLKAQSRTSEAIATYKIAVKTLESLRTDLVAINTDVQNSFRDSVEPVYRELVSLILQPDPATGTVSQEHLRTARELMESLQLAELDNFFREACLDSSPEQIDGIDPDSAIIYPIILSDRLEVILSVPGQPLRNYATPIDQQQLEETVQKMRQSLRPIFSTAERLRLSKEVYNWLIRPAEADLAQSDISTLVFVLDGSLRNLPMAALHDGQQYLLQKYNIALTPGLQLLEVRSLNRRHLKTLAVGLSEARQGFDPLPAVETELEMISSSIPSRVLLNQQFTRPQVEDNLSLKPPSTILHLATHGQFSSQAEETFLLTWDDRINVKDLDQLLRNTAEGNPIELLVLSACETATGDRQAALGLAGVAVRSGARSTLATLWQVNDLSTAVLMAEFYRVLTESNVGKAEALRQAQLSLLQQPRYRDPYYWAAFVLIGNWL
ncbi:MAG: CHAT domain-containing protein [Arthrospira sp. SH-MAG29]|nr:CHAT domain-containing protein [Arthrospira sp. SH-MAG29]MBS0015889.1 CHAT domain-containing protein [Arthrospira sp. SH-MAG29]